MTVCFSVRQHAGSQHGSGFRDTEYVTIDEDASKYYRLEASFLIMDFSQPLEAVCRLAKDGGIDGQLLVDVDEVGILDVIPLADLLNRNAEADRDAGEDVAADNRVNDVLTVVHIGALRVLLPGAVAAGNFIEFFFVNSHCSFLLFQSFF